jgi:hypothetical protein
MIASSKSERRASVGGSGGGGGGSNSGGSSSRTKALHLSLGPEQQLVVAADCGQPGASGPEAGGDCGQVELHATCTLIAR